MPQPRRFGMDVQRLDAAPGFSLTKLSVQRTAVGGILFERAEFEPGWRWSEHSRDPEGPSSCQQPHVGLLVSGGLGVLMDDGSSYEIHAGDVYAIPPGHDTWTLGDHPCVAIDVAPSPLE